MPTTTEYPQCAEVRSGKVHAIKKVVQYKNYQRIRFICGHAITVGEYGTYAGWWVIEHPGPVNCGRCAFAQEQAQLRVATTP